MDDVFFEAEILNYAVPHGSIFRQLLFLISNNDLHQSSPESGSYLYADGTCIFYESKDVHKIENFLNKEFSALCSKFVDNKLSIYFRRDKTECILFCKIKRSSKLNITYRDHYINQCHTVEYLGCHLDCNISNKSMQNLITLRLKRLLYNTLLQRYFDYRCISWFPFLIKNLKLKLQTAQNKCIRQQSPPMKPTLTQ